MRCQVIDSPESARPNASLTFAELRAANVARLPQFKNAKGEPAHSEPDGSDWCLAQWCNAVTGELGEAANIIKKIERGDITLDDARVALGKEFADVVTYLDILAFRAGVDLGDATRDKWNEVSARVGCNLRLAPRRGLVQLVSGNYAADVPIRPHE
jgi:NTP pyrophosphatase (non-canonical NTP hydrolase)